jgi:hypothetical protein
VVSTPLIVPPPLHVMSRYPIAFATAGQVNGTHVVTWRRCVTPCLTTACARL